MRSNRKSGVVLIAGLLLAVSLFFLSFPAYWLAEYYAHLDEFSRSVKANDRDGAKRGLEALKEDYNHFTEWKLQYPADKFLFSNMHLYEAAVSKLNEDYEKVEKSDLKNRSGWEASYILGVSRFWALHAAYQDAMSKKNKAKMNQILGIVLDEVRSDFEKCVKDGPGPELNYNCSFNYDITSDPAAAARALASPKPQIRYMQGPDGDKPGDGKGPKKKGQPKKGPSDGKEPGQGGAKRIG